MSRKQCVPTSSQQEGLPLGGAEGEGVAGCIRRGEEKGCLVNTVLFFTNVSDLGDSRHLSLDTGSYQKAAFGAVLGSASNTKLELNQPDVWHETAALHLTMHSRQRSFKASWWCLIVSCMIAAWLLKGWHFPRFLPMEEHPHLHHEKQLMVDGSPYFSCHVFLLEHGLQRG